jgi:SNF family Na+-dependent transporter
MILLVVQVILAVPALTIGSYIEYSDLIWGSTMQPVGGVIAVIALTWSLGRAKALGEIRRSSDLAIPAWLFYWLKYGIPVGIIATLVYGWADTDVVQELLHN